MQKFRFATECCSHRQPFHVPLVHLFLESLVQVLSGRSWAPCVGALH